MYSYKDKIIKYTCIKNCHKNNEIYTYDCIHLYKYLIGIISHIRQNVMK